jgi:hypothetical protein
VKDIMNADKQGVDANVGEGNLVREGKDFDTKARTDVLTQDAGKKGGKSYDTGCLKMADDMSLYNTSGK